METHKKIVPAFLQCEVWYRATPEENVEIYKFTAGRTVRYSDIELIARGVLYKNGCSLVLRQQIVIFVEQDNGMMVAV